MGRITSFSKQVIVFFLVTALMIRPTFAAVGGWDLKNPVAQGASTVYDATKNVVINGKKFIKESSVKITPTATSVAKVLARGGAGYALSVAVEQLLGSVDWVLDPANNQIKYKVSTDPIPSGPIVIIYSDQALTNEKARFSGEPNDACNSYAKSIGYKSGYYTGNACAGINDQYPSGIFIDYARAASYVNQGVQEEKSIPLTTVAQKVISNAEGGDVNAQVATTAAAADIVAEAEKDDAKARPIASQAEANATTKPADAAESEKANEAQGQAKPNTANPEATDIALKFPVFCNWAPTVCEAAQTVISFPQTLTNWWETGKTKAEEWATSISEAWTKVKEEYADKPEENTDTELDIPDQSPPDINTDISFGGSCPASRSVPVSFAGISTEIEFSFQWFCEVASIAKPVVISISAFAAALIVAGVRTEDD
ncbi:virulence factor TspB C-terminal domain-related protein [Acinetobacter junii]|uniref:virulence factor TspB C-terminal domain-related protein n=1 Tax=Acinetobacter junii TaxID=40215 RepID=UPI00125F821B|nr:virulence factor TspB C-terminal domain-related protein [Acinetobacter junii]